MTNTAFPMQYLDKAMNGLHDLGLLPEGDEAREEPIIALLNQISELDEARVTAIARTLNQASLFNDIVREQVQAMEIGERYEKITNAFNSIRDDAKTMVDQIEDGKLDTFERIGNVWMKVTRGDIPDRFEKIKKTYLEVAEDSKDQINREHVILESYQDFRGALKESEVLALEVLWTRMFAQVHSNSVYAFSVILAVVLAAAVVVVLRGKGSVGGVSDARRIEYSLHDLPRLDMDLTGRPAPGDDGSKPVFR